MGIINKTIAVVLGLALLIPTLKVIGLMVFLFRTVPEFNALTWILISSLIPLIPIIALCPVRRIISTIAKATYEGFKQL
jgi:uncharacterized membrane protein required for colicin V production